MIVAHAKLGNNPAVVWTCLELSNYVKIFNVLMFEPKFAAVVLIVLYILQLFHSMDVNCDFISDQ